MSEVINYFEFFLFVVKDLVVAEFDATLIVTVEDSWFVV